jgi:redox-sensitive bicupin YhaK (pirin superfamily)
MITYLDFKKMGRANHGWLDSHFHFSFAEYYNPSNMQFGVLRVLNDDIVQPGTGFDTHPHKDMEIISYVVDGELTHGDSMGNRQTLSRGQVQYMSAGTGVLHSEYNLGDKRLRFLQIWVLPDGKGYEPNYGDYRFEFDDRRDCWMPIATWTENRDSAAPIHIHANVNISASIISSGKRLALPLEQGRQAYLKLIEGAATVRDIALSAGDALEITAESVEIEASEDAHLIVIEMAEVS